MPDPTQNFDDLPPALGENLRALYAPPAPFPDARDAAILAAVRAQSAARARRRRWLLVTGGALAAAVGLAATLWWIQPHTVSTPVASAYVRTGDIRDAFYLERQLQQSTKTRTLPSAWDINHDGRIDESDVQLLALVAVRLDKGATP